MMMDEKGVRAQLEEAKAKLARIEDERNVYLTLIQGFEAWLRVYAFRKDGAVQALLPLTAATESQKEGALVQRLQADQIKPLELRPTILRVLREARGAPLHSREILLRVRALGADTKAKDPLGIIDLVASNLKVKSNQPIEKVGPRTWKWVEPDVPMVEESWGNIPAEAIPTSEVDDRTTQDNSLPSTE